ncbi:MAG: hypothetical protein A2V70_09725 [Planctomycetes bacterium RBG_13_63_9]|nr:MAG: hypothetical protein A2V70_09725 [Planctomycetes bacterium RBG_13_63_9]
MKIDWPREFPGVHWLDEQEDRAVLDVLHQRSLFRYYGPHKPKYVSRLESAARELYGTKHALAVNSGSGALIVALGALGIGPGREVIVPIPSRLTAEQEAAGADAIRAAVTA